MNRKHTFPVLFLTCLVLVSLSMVVALATAPWGFTVEGVDLDKEKYTDGYVGNCRLNVSNTGDIDLMFTKVEMRTDFGNFSWTGEFLVPKGGEEEVEISFKIPIGTEPGDYSLEFYFEFEYDWEGGSEEGYRTYSSDKKLVVRGAPKGALGDIPGFPIESVLAGISLATIVLLKRRRGSLPRAG